MRKNNKLTGALGENIACEYLQKLGYEIVERNWHYSRYGELDIIALDKNTLVFIEVKTRKSLNFGHPFEAIDEKKYNQVKTTAQAYLNTCDKKFQACRIDAVSVILTTPPEITHVKNIF